MGIALEIHRVCREAVRHHGAGRIESVRVAVGELTAVEPELLRFAWEAVVAGGPHAGSELEVVWCRATQRCSRCGDVELTTSDVGLELESEGGEGRYRFACPFCGMTERRPANHRVVSILLATGVTYEIVPVGSPITEHEIARFVRELDQGDWFSELAATD